MQEAQSAKVPSFEIITRQFTANSYMEPTKDHSMSFVYVIPPDIEAGKLYSGTLTFSASKSVNVVVFNEYRPDGEVFGEPLIMPSIGGPLYAATIIKPGPNGEDAKYGTVNFVGNAVGIHSTDDTPFTVTVSVRAIGKVPDTTVPESPFPEPPHATEMPHP